MYKLLDNFKTMDGVELCESMNYTINSFPSSYIKIFQNGEFLYLIYEQFCNLFEVVYYKPKF